MPDPMQQKKWLEAMRQRAEMMNELYERIEELSAQNDRQGVIDLVSNKLGSTPIENGNTVTIGSMDIEFAEDGSVSDIRTDDGTASFSVKPGEH